MKYLVASAVAVFSLVLVVLIISRLITNRFKGKSLRAKHRNLMLVTCAAAVAILGATALLVITSAPAVRAPEFLFPEVDINKES